MKNIKTKLTRRAVLDSAWKTMTTAGVGAVVAGLGAQKARAAVSNGRAVVCIYLFGGNDANNLIVPLSQHAPYAAARGELAIPRDALLPVRTASSQEEYGLHPSLLELQPLFQSGTMAVVANVGAAEGASCMDPALRYVRPGYALPGWAAETAGVTGPTGRNSILEGLSEVAGLAHQAAGDPLATGQPAGPFYCGFPSPLTELSRITGNQSSGLAMLAPGVTLSTEDRARLTAELSSAAQSLRTTFPATGLGAQLYQVAGLLKAGRQFGMSNQVFFCSLGSFGTGIRQLEPHAALLRDLSSAMAAFFHATEEMGVAQSVTTFTDSEYSRTLQPNRMSGSDPAWGSHHLVLGGSVLGADVYGRFPALSLGGPDDVNGKGVFRPAQTKDQYAATLATWFGLEYPEVVRTIPRITQHARPSLGFMAG